MEASSPESIQFGRRSVSQIAYRGHKPDCIRHNGHDDITGTHVVLRYKAYPDYAEKSAESPLGNHCLRPVYTGNRYQNPTDSDHQRITRRHHAVHHDVLNRNNHHTIVYVQDKSLHQMAHTDHAPSDATKGHLHHLDRRASGRNRHQITRLDLALLFLQRINARWRVRLVHSGFSDG